MFEGVHGAGELGGVAGDSSGAAIRIADQVCLRAASCRIVLVKCPFGANHGRETLDSSILDVMPASDPT